MSKDYRDNIETTKKNMLNGNIRNRIINVIAALTAYSATLAWIQLNDCACFYLGIYGRRLRGGIGIGLLIHWLFLLIIALSILITVLKRKEPR